MLAFIGDALWVVALAIMFGASRQAWSRTTPGEKLKLPIGMVGRALALWALPLGAFAFSLGLAVEARDRPFDGDAAVIVFGVRAVAAPLLALLHLRWLKAALEHRPDA